jgi:hypothetical protein
MRHSNQQVRASGWTPEQLAAIETLRAVKPRPARPPAVRAAAPARRSVVQATRDGAGRPRATVRAASRPARPAPAIREPSHQEFMAARFPDVIAGAARRRIAPKAVSRGPVPGWDLGDLGPAPLPPAGTRRGVRAAGLEPIDATRQAATLAPRPLSTAEVRGEQVRAAVSAASDAELRTALLGSSLSDSDRQVVADELDHRAFMTGSFPVAAAAAGYERRRLDLSGRSGSVLQGLTGS